MAYRPDVDGLRAIAALAVIGGHTSLLRGGYTGVDIFFVISGFLISGIIFRELQSGTFRYCDFLARRVKRIFPALILVLVAVWVFGWFVLLPDEYNWLGTDIAAGAGFVSDFVSYTWVPTANVPSNYSGRQLLGHLWSLGVEEQFYLLWPLLLVVGVRLGRTLAVVMVAITVASFASIAVATHWDATAAYFFPWNRLWELSSGGLLAYAQREREDSTFRFVPQGFTAHALGVVGVGLLLASVTGFNEPYAVPGWWALAPCLGAFLTIWAGRESFVNRFLLAAPPLVFVGLISYPLYLWHQPALWVGHIMESRWVLPWSTSACAVIAAFFLAYLTYRYVEKPIRSYSNTKRITGGLLAAMALCGALGCLALSGVVPGRTEFSGRSSAIAAEAHGASLSEFVRIGAGQREILFVGDDTIRQYSYRISQVLTEEASDSFTAIFATRKWCVPGAIDMPRAAFTFTFTRRFVSGCHELLRNADLYARKPQVQTIVIAACWYFYFADFPDFDHFGLVSPIKAGTDRAIEMLAAVIGGWVESGKRVYVVLDIPVGLEFDPHQIARRGIDFRARDRSEVEQALQPVESQLVLAVRRAGAVVINPRDAMCNKSECPAFDAGGDPIYSDMWSLQPAYVAAAADFIDQTVRDAGDIEGHRYAN